MRLRLFFYSITLLISCDIYSQPSTIASKREFRGVWLATVKNIDWPSKAGLSTEAQKNEMLRILNDHQSSGVNAVMFQVRPTTDAFYGKSRELWSIYLTGKQGLPPDPYYDPLEFAVTEAHKRGMELHAWFNPYRATYDQSSITSSDHITRVKPEWFFTYGGQKLFNPGIPEVREYIIQVILDVVKNYDIDGVHFDDYFYPYPAKGQPIPDAATFKLYGKNFDNINDWRRHNVDTLIHELYKSIHAAKTYVKFGISPFGIWKNKSQDSLLGSETNGGSSYVELYADSRKWVERGWVDYINPQIYWPIGYRLAAFEKLLDWWSNNTFGKHLYIGQGAYRAPETVFQANLGRGQIAAQVRLLRNNPRVQGSVFFSSKSLTNNLAGVRDSLKNLYQYPALQPAMLWLDDTPPQAPLQLTAKLLADKTVQLNWKEPIASERDGDTAYGYVIYKIASGKAIDLQDARNIIKITFDKKATSFNDTKIASGVRYTYIVTAIDRLKNESAPSNSIMP